jgi:hypothetical protein
MVKRLLKCHKLISGAPQSNTFVFHLLCCKKLPCKKPLLKTNVDNNNSINIFVVVDEVVVVEDAPKVVEGEEEVVVEEAEGGVVGATVTVVVMPLHPSNHGIFGGTHARPVSLANT